MSDRPNLAEYLRTAAARAFVWGTHDCCTFIADWTQLHGYPDPMAFIRGKYATPAHALRAIRKYGDLHAIVRHGMPETLVAAGDPQMGDVAVIDRETDDGLNQACAIFGGQRWVSLGLAGIESGPATPHTIWRP